MPLDFCISLSLTSWSGPAGAAVPSLPVDNFNDNSRDVAIWNTGNLRATAAAVGTVSEANSRLELTPPTSTAGLNYNGYVTVNTFNMTGLAIYAQTSDLSTLSSVTEPCMTMGADANNNYFAVYSNAQLFLKQTKAGTETSSGATAYVAASHKWWRLRHDGGSPGNILFDVAPNTASNPPISGDWVNIATMARDAAVVITSCKLALFSGTWTSNASPGMAWFDGFNTAT